MPFGEGVQVIKEELVFKLSYGSTETLLGFIFKHKALKETWSDLPAQDWSAVRTSTVISNLTESGLNTVYPILRMTLLYFPMLIHIMLSFNILTFDVVLTGWYLKLARVFGAVWICQESTQSQIPGRVSGLFSACWLSQCADNIFCLLSGCPLVVGVKIADHEKFEDNVQRWSLKFIFIYASICISLREVR